MLVPKEVHLKYWSLANMEPGWSKTSMGHYCQNFTLILNLIHIIFQLMNSHCSTVCLCNLWSIDQWPMVNGWFFLICILIQILSPFCQSPRKRTAWSCNKPRHANSLRRHTCNTSCYNPMSEYFQYWLSQEALEIHVRILAILKNILYNIHWHISKTRDRSRAHISKWKDSLNFWGPYK